MLPNKLAQSMMARGLDSTMSNDHNRQVIAVSNFMWRTDQLLWKRDDTGASKMLARAVGIGLKMAAIPPELAQELRIRQKLIVDRAVILPQLLGSDHAADGGVARARTRFELWHHPSLDRLDVLDFCREEAFGNEFYWENDNRDAHSTFLLAFMGDEIVGGVRWREAELDDGCSVVVLDQTFISPGFRGKGLGRSLFLQAQRRVPGLLLAMKKSWKLYAHLANSLAGTHKVFREDVFMSNLNAPGGGFFTLFQPLQ
ncbi:hypothetical protein BASA81_005841 [Batrachochytrium salamandrivorans]|nr:hypothetical protein BASA81_005841 [Batrachochytrium salamandrivorans]